MKKYFLPVALLLGLASSTLQAQVAFGVRAGVSISNIRGEGANNAAVSQYTNSVTGLELPSFLEGINIGSLAQADPKSLTSFFAGAYMDLPLLSAVHLEPGVYLASRGYRLENALRGVAELNIVNRSYYVEIPVYARVFVSEGLNIFAGPQFSILVSNTFKTDISAGIGSFNLANFDFENDNSSNLNNIDVGLAAGVGYELPFGLNLQLGYDLGFVQFAENTKAYNGVWKLGAGITF
ncbi:MAG: porin family protein [Tunicatimonas sp.]